jgi:hypothetical protein
MSNKTRIEPRERIQQKSVSFHRRQIDFFDEHPEFKPDLYCRAAVDEQIKLIDTEFL